MIDLEKLRKFQIRLSEVIDLMGQPAIACDPKQMTALGQEHGQLRDVVATIDKYEGLIETRAEMKEIIEANEDSDLVQMAYDELAEINPEIPKLEDALRGHLIPKDPEDSRNAIIEIRAGTGGDEASLFAGDLYRMYERFAGNEGWKIEIIDISDGTAGGLKEVIFSLKGYEAFGSMKYESGTHRVQRVPSTESSGRIHTSAATVAVLPEAEEVDIQINDKDIQTDVYRSGGKGGQSVNTTDSAVRLTHIPTGMVVTCQDERSQLKNKARAMTVLRSRLYERELAIKHAARSQKRKSMVGSGDRSGKIRTYNWPQGRVTDHRLEGSNKNHQLQKVIAGELMPIILALRVADHLED